MREAENIILTQIKDYYETQLKQAEQKITKHEFRETQSIMTRKLRRGKLKPKKESISHRVLDSPVREETDIKRYAINSYQRQFNMSLSKARLE